MTGTLASPSQVDIGYVAETDYGSTPAGATFKTLRTVQFGVNLSKDTYQSEERRSDRQTSDLRHGYRRVEGDITAELSVQSFDDFLQAVLGGTWASGVTMGPFTAGSTQAGSSRITIGSATFAASGLKVGDIFVIKDSGVSSLNNTRHVAASVGTTTIEIEGSTLATSVGALSSTTIEVVGNKLLIGSTYRSFSMERKMIDVDWFQLFSGVRISRMSMTVPPSGLVQVTFGVMGQNQAAWSSTTAASTYASATTTSPVAAVDGELYEGGTRMGVITGFELTVDNGMVAPQVVGRNTTPNVLWGKRAQITGRITVLFEDPTMLNKFVNETESSLDVRVADSSTFDSQGFIRIRCPRIKYTGGDLDDGQEATTPITMPFVALKPTGSTDDASALVVQRSNS